MDTAPSKNDLLVAEAKAELERRGIDTEGKRPDELLNMARDLKNQRQRGTTKPE